jgi:hypothetical protein
MSEWSLGQLLTTLHEDIHRRLEASRKSFGHSTTKGNATEGVWLKLLEEYLPERYAAVSGHVVDSQGVFSDQIDIIVFDRQYSPFILKYEEQIVVPAESVYAAFEAKQAISAEQVAYAQAKLTSVRRLHRTSLPIPHAGGVYPAKNPITILGGLLTFESDWTPCFGDPIQASLLKDQQLGRLDIGCVAAHGHFYRDRSSAEYKFVKEGKPATAFLLKLISELQFSGTVPMIDVMAYAKWLTQ